MRRDLDYLAGLLNVFVEAETAYVTLQEFSDKDFVDFKADSGEKLEKFIFHCELLMDVGLIANDSGYARGIDDIGITRTNNHVMYVSSRCVRLTSQGHDFASSLNNREVLEKLKRELSDAPFKAIFEGGQKLLSHYLNKRLEAVMAD